MKLASRESAKRACSAHDPDHRYRPVVCRVRGCPHNAGPKGHGSCLACDRVRHLAEFSDSGSLATLVVKLENDVNAMKARNSELEVQCATLERSVALSMTELTNARLETKVQPGFAHSMLVTPCKCMRSLLCAGCVGSTSMVPCVRS